MKYSNILALSNYIGVIKPIPMKNLSLLLLACALLASCKPRNNNVWTKEYEAKTYDEIDQGLIPLFKVDSQRKKYTLWILKKFKAELPKGVESVSEDSLRTLTTKFFKECPYKTDDLQASIPWTTNSEESFKQGVLRSGYVQSIDKNLRQKFCDCLVKDVKTIYPKELISPIPDSVYRKIADDCKPR